MGKKIAAAAAVIVLAALAVFLFVYNGRPVSISVDAPYGILEGKMDEAQLTGEITFADGRTSEVYITESRLNEESRRLVSIPGTHIFSYVYGGYELGFELVVLEDEAFTEQGFIYRLNPDVVTCYLAGCLNEGSVEIPSVYKGAAVTGIGERAFEGAYLDALLIPESVTEIGSEAFKDVIGLYHLTVPASVRKIGDGFISGCMLRSVTFMGDIPGCSMYMLSNSAFSQMSFYLGDTEGDLYRMLTNLRHEDGSVIDIDINGSREREIPEAEEDVLLKVFGRAEPEGGAENFACDAYSSVSAATEGELISLLRLGLRPDPIEGSEAERIWTEARKLLSSAVPEGADDYVIARNILTALCERVTYTAAGSEDPLGYVHRISGALLYGAAVCDGYSLTYELLLNMAGVECVYLEGRVNEWDTAGHAWNKVKINGEWYIADVTFCDLSDITLENGSKAQAVSLANFLVSDETEPRICDFPQPEALSTMKLPDTDMAVFYTEQEFFDYFRQNGEKILDAGLVEAVFEFELSAEKNVVSLVNKALAGYVPEAGSFFVAVTQNDYLRKGDQAVIIAIWRRN